MSTKAETNELPIRIFSLPFRLDGSDETRATTQSYLAEVSKLYPRYRIVTATPFYNALSPNGAVTEVNILFVLELK